MNLNVFLPKIFLNLGKSYNESLKNNIDIELHDFISASKVKLKTSNRYSILVVGESKDKRNESPLSLTSRLAKYKIIYYLAPIEYDQNISNAGFLVIINYPKIPLTININKSVYKLNNVSNPFTLLDLRQGKVIL